MRKEFLLFFYVQSEDDPYTFTLVRVQIENDVSEIMLRL